MVICKYFLRGTCRFGENCKNEHTYNDSSSSVLRKKQDIEPSVLIKSVNNDMDKAEKGNQWPLSCYGPFQGKPCFPGFEDKCFEEVRLGMYEAERNGTSEPYKQQLTHILQEARMKIRALQNPNSDAVNVLKELFSSNSTENISSNVFTNTNTFVNTAISPNQTNSIFGNTAPTSPSQNPFSAQLISTNPTSNFTFSVPENKSIFGNVQSNSIFGVGGQNTSIFAAQPQQTFTGANIFQSSTTINQNTNSNMRNHGQSIFAQPANSPPPFGAQTQTSNSPFSAQTPTSNSPFAAQTPPSNSPFAAQTAASISPFSAQVPTNQSPFSAQNQASSNPPPFSGQLPFGVHSQVPANQSPFAAQTQSTNNQLQFAVQNKATSNPPPFGAQNQSTNNPPPFGAQHNFGANLFQQNAIVGQNQSPFGFAPVISENKSIFSQQTNPITGGNIFSNSAAENQAVISQNQLTATDHSRNIFGTNIGVKTEKQDDTTIYSRLEDLNESDTKCYESHSFEFARIPEKAPTLQLCS